ncbi:hypothetical protein CC80DRAFT_556530 [Byssothecium circinans]|uniref:DUF6594 domain-containing protein n=1 Tax=Byssothecium circinans TaxID=147558 RepID=A0A6A5TH49_9PLEO|nr:hypothetical protein CC80DRAFT_556559 [Byssothecium circinans]KAF1948234.1 hypothetical protein CC80DRAFT_556530 [Byssothecium circinans]
MDDEKTPQSPASPTSTDDTLRGDAIIHIREEDEGSAARSSSEDSRSSVNDAPAQPHDEKRRPTFLRRVTGSFKSEPDPPSVTETKTRKLENTPSGFPRLAAFQSSEANFSLYRSFSYLHSRILLDLQDELRELERELDDIDWDDFEDNPNRLKSRETDVNKAATEGDARNRRVILREIKDKLMEYDEVLIKARKLESFEKPSDRNYRSVRRYYHNEKPLMDEEMDSIRSKEDTVSLRTGREWAKFDGGVENVISKCDDWLQRIFRTKEPPLQRYFRTPELRAKTTNSFITFYSSSRIDQLINVFITFVIFILLVVPVITMYKLTSTSSHVELSNSNSTATMAPAPSSDKNTFNAVGVLIVFTLLFSAAMSLLTRAARHELFAASAAYCAILVVFIGNFTGPGN